MSCSPGAGPVHSPRRGAGGAAGPCGGEEPAGFYSWFLSYLGVPPLFSFFNLSQEERAEQTRPMHFPHSPLKSRETHPSSHLSRYV